MPNLVEIIVKAQDQASSTLNNIKEGGVDLEGKMQAASKALGVAMTAVGAAGLAMVQSTSKTRAELANTGVTMGLTRDEMRGLALDTTNVTFPLESVNKTFDLLVRAGVRDEEQLKRVATAFDTLGDATKSNAETVTANLLPAMKTFGLTFDDMADKTDMFTYLQNKTTMSLQDFNSIVSRISPDLVEQGLTLEELTATIVNLEAKGYAPGIVLTREFGKAATRMTKEGISLSEAMGITAEEIENTKAKMAEATGITQEYADATNEQYTLMDKVKQKWSEITFSAGAFLDPLQPMLALMTALGPAMIFFSSSMGIAAVRTAAHTVAIIAHTAATIVATVATGAWTVATTAFGVAMTIATGPIGLIILAIGALIAVGVLLVKNWDKVGNFFNNLWNGILEGAKVIPNVLIGIYNKMIGFLSGKKLFNIKIPSWVPKIGGKGFELKLPTIPKIPSLEYGGIVPGLPGQPVPIIAHGGERYLGVRSVPQSMGMGGLELHFHGVFMGTKSEMSKVVSQYVLPEIRKQQRFAYGRAQY